jgi:hypothetical protein
LPKRYELVALLASFQFVFSCKNNYIPLINMTDQQTTRSAFPDPPNYFKRYTTENLELLNQAKKSGVFPENPIISADVPEFRLEALEPPLPPTDDYTIFDQKWQVI